ncbi:hypothetical protein [Actinosynnema sp. NPDC020468]|uniref:hypothetical protein n=1 Tax=Actinosynnema sp. NPDC020468 TaxID=3154488 RepID=UPI0033DD7852
MPLDLGEARDVGRRHRRAFGVPQRRGAAVVAVLLRGRRDRCRLVHPGPRRHQPGAQQARPRRITAARLERSQLGGGAVRVLPQQQRDEVLAQGQVAGIGLHLAGDHLAEAVARLGTAHRPAPSSRPLSRPRFAGGMQ